jgi:hypothetical protein
MSYYANADPFRCPHQRALVVDIVYPDPDGPDVGSTGMGLVSGRRIAPIN